MAMCRGDTRWKKTLGRPFQAVCFCLRFPLFWGCNSPDFFEHLTDKNERTESANSGDNLCAGPALTKHSLFFAYSRFFAAAVAA